MRFSVFSPARPSGRPVARIAEGSSAIGHQNPADSPRAGTNAARPRVTGLLRSAVRCSTRRPLRAQRAALAGLTAVLVLWMAPSALAASAWSIDALSNSSVAPGGTFSYLFEIRNAGDVTLDGSSEAISLTATLPAGLTVQGGLADALTGEPLGDWSCSAPGGQTVTCQTTDSSEPCNPDAPCGCCRSRPPRSQPAHARLLHP